jgi:formate dehydrogenase subunit gamma
MSDSLEQKINEIVDGLCLLEGALLPILHAVQDKLGYIPSSSVPILSRRLNLSRAEIHGVISFYHDFRTEPGGTHTVQICRAEACQAMGSRQLETHAKLALGVGFGATTEDGRVTLEPVYCLGNCACAPSIRIDDRVHARVDNQRFDQLINTLDKSGDVK